MANKYLKIKSEFMPSSKENTFYELLLKYKNTTVFTGCPLTDEKLDKQTQETNKERPFILCYAGALLNMYYFHSIGKDVTLKLGTPFKGDSKIAHSWVEVDGKEYHVNRCKIGNKIQPCYELESIFISRNLDKDEIINLFVKKELLTEDKRTLWISKSRNAKQYTDTSRGKNRWERKKYSKVANSVKQFNQIDMNELFKKDILLIKVPVIGETSNYEVDIKVEGIVAEIAKNIKNNNNKLEFKTVFQAVTSMLNTADIYSKCTCADFKYQFAHYAIIHGRSTDDSSKDPGPGKGIANPTDDKGSGCKHILCVMNNLNWVMKLTSTILNYIHYAEENLTQPFLKVIFPKLYGIPADEMIEQDLVDDDKYLKTSKGVIDAINDWAKVRGRYKKGSNKNSVTGTGGRNKKVTSEEEAK